MKSSATLPWAFGLLTAASVVLASCEGRRSNQGTITQGSTSNPSDSSARDEESAPDSVALLPGGKFNPHAGRIPTSRAAYDSALQSIKTYKKVNKKAVVTSNYFSDSLIRVLIGKEGSETDKKVSGLRVYRTYTHGQKGYGVLIVPVDSEGVDIKNSTIKLKDGFKAEYLFGTSQERCPDNCEGCALN
jgi:hypothetical protein